MKAKTFRLIVFPIAAVLLAILIVLSVVVSMFSKELDKFVVGYKDGTTSGAARAAGKALSEQIEGEGAVLVKNEKPTDDAAAPLLPMKKANASKVNVFGWASTDWVVSGSGSGQVKGSKTTKLLDKSSPDGKGALTLAGIEYNHDLENMYENYMSHRNMSENGGGVNDAQANAGALKSFNYEFSRLYEPNINDVKTSGNNAYTQTLLDNAKAYSDTAIVVIGRVSGESNDSPKVQYKNYLGGNGTPSAQYIDESRTYLEISTEEEALLTYVGANYENVIVLINSTNVMELGFMDTIPGLDACLVVATTGTTGTRAIPRLLYSDLHETEGYEAFTPITPSGKLADTYAYDLSTSSTYVDTGSGNDSTHFYTNSTGLYPTTVKHTNGSSDEDYRGVAYQDYRESIYMGYKWYETADAEGFWTSEFAKQHWTKPDGTPINGYNDVVQYPFGYGLSYTSFSWNITHMNYNNGASLSTNDVNNGEITIGVTVTNTGTIPGQDVVELYYSAPYTKGTTEIEKAAVNLAAFGKTTQVLQPGESQYVPLTLKISDMASYDYLGAKVTDGGYILEEGIYTLTLRTDSHTVATDKMVIDDDTDSSIKEATATLTFNISKDERVLTEATNRFTGNNTTDGVAIDGNSDGTATIVYLSRADFAKTFPIDAIRSANNPDRVMDDRIKALNLYTKAMATTWDSGHGEGEVSFGIDSGDYLVYEKQTFTDEDGEEYEQEAINELGKKLGMDYNAPEWETVLDSITKSEMTNLVLHGYTATRAIGSIGKPETKDFDGPNQIGSFISSYPEATGYSSIVLAQTWNLELAYSMGLAFGEECNSYGIQGWYGPGVNVHRSPFGGRNYEYYSEDAYMSGMMCAKVVTAAKNKGVFAYLKHLCLYEGESGRDGMYTWVTEQAFREIYAKPFELAVKVGGSNAIMTSYGRIGAVWTGGSEALLTELVRGEWNFQGAFLTDYADHHDFMNGDQMLRAGGDLWMDWWQLGSTDSGKFVCDTNSDAFNLALRKATKNIVYMWLNSLATNADYNEKIKNGEIDDNMSIPSQPVLNFRWYIPVVVVVDVLLAAGAGVLIFFGIKKKDKVVVDGEPETSETVEEPVTNTAEETKSEPVTQTAEPTENTAAEPETNTEGEAETPAPAKKSRAKKTPPSEK